MIFLELFWTFFKIGAFTFGGGYAMLPLMQEQVLAKGWMPLNMIIDFIAVSESTPGPFAINMSTYIGSQMGGQYGVLGALLGSFCATLGVVLPSFVIILIIANIYEKFKESSTVKGVMTGLKPAVVGLIGSAALSIFLSVFVPNGIDVSYFSQITLYVYVIIFAISITMAFKKVHPIIIILFSAAIGILSGYLL